MRTLAVMHLAEITGPARSLYPRVAALAERGELITVLPANGPVADLYAQLGPTCVRPYRALTQPRGTGAMLRAATDLLREIWTFRREIRRARPDIVVIATAMLPAALVAARLESVPAVAYVAEILEKPSAPGLLRSIANEALLRLTVACASAVVCASDAVASQFHRNGRVRRIYPGVRLYRRRTDRRHLRAEFGVPDGALCIGVVGSISEGRGQDVVIRALPSILASVPATYCLIAGVPHPRAVDLEFRDSLDVLAATLGVTEHVIFTGYMDVVEDLYEAADVIINPARVNEGFGRVAIEALAAGRPVVSSRTGAVPEILDDGQTALLVEPGDPAAVARAVLRLVDDAELRRRLMVAGRALVGRRFRESSGVDEFLRVVDTVLLTHGNEHGRAGLG